MPIWRDKVSWLRILFVESRAMPNSLAYLMLLIWPLVSIYLFRRMPLERAIIWCILGGYLILPPVAEFDLPLIPDMDKHSIPAVTAFVLCVFMMKKPVPLWPSSRGAKALVLLFVLGAIPTVLSNTDPLQADVIENSYPIQIIMTHLPGLTWRDLGSVLINQVIVLLPFFLARQYLATEQGMRALLVALVIASLIYSIPAMIELRLSPQMNIWVYGFFQHDFGQMVRGSGYRPIVFLQHALWLAFLAATSAMACACLTRYAPEKEKTRYAVALLYLMILLVLFKSLASQVYVLFYVPLILLAPLRFQVTVALGLAIVGVVYPMMRNLGLIPVDAIMAVATEISADRAQSLGYRLGNEEILMERAHQKPWFGWGGWGRNLIRDVETGRILTIPDGRWIIVFGTFGWVGYVAEMGLLALPIYLLWRRTGGTVQPTPYVSVIALIVAATMMDMLLNATIIPFTWLCVGAMLGYVERLKIDAPHKSKLFSEGTLLAADPAKSKPRTLF
ncbi:MAG: hypothetical protein GJ676_02105 [Rhodobacteraceae bacterium]|nr:hypothetical protein [Paracoccaceae bacterium]